MFVFKDCMSAFILLKLRIFKPNNNGKSRVAIH